MKNSRMLTKNTAFHIALILVLGFLVYSNTFGSPFAYDDNVFLQNVRDKNISNIPSMFTELTGPWASRPLLHATLSLNYYVGGMETWGYHAANIALHLANGVLLYILILLTGRHLGYTEDDLRLTAVFSALIFTLHPLQTETVTNIVSRSMLMTTMFYLSGLIMFLKAAVSERRRLYYGTGLFVVALLGVSSREDFITFPLMLVLYDMLFVARFRTKEILGRWRLYLLVALACGYLAYLVTHNTYDKEWTLGKGISPLHYALTQLNVINTYLKLFLLPVNQNIDYDYPTAQTLFELPTMLSFIVYISLWAFGILLAKRKPIASFGFLWFLVTLLPVSFMLAALAAAGLSEVSLGDVIFEHRAYLPTVGITVLAVVSLVRMRRASNIGKVAVPLIFVLIVALGAAAYARNTVWSDGITLWKDAISKSPGKARGYNNIATYYWKNDQKDIALESLKSAISLERRFADAHYNIGIAYADKGLFDEAIDHYIESLSIKPDMRKTHFQLANAYMAKGLFSNAIEHYEQEIRISPYSANAFVGLGIAYASTGRIEEAIDCYGRALSLNPDLVNAHYNLGNAYLQQGLLEKAVDHYEQAIRLKPDIAGAYVNLGIAYKNAGRIDMAMENYEKAVNLEQNNPDAHYNLANAYMRQGRADDAIAHYERTIILRPNDPDAHSNLAVAYRQKGLKEKADQHIRIANELKRKSGTE